MSCCSPTGFDGDFRQGGNQLLEDDVVSARDFAHLERLSTSQLHHLALIAHHVYGSVDLAHRCVMALEERRALQGGSTVRYLQSLG